IAIEGEKASPGSLYQWYKTTDKEDRERIEAHFESQHFMPQPLEALIVESSHGASIQAIRHGNVLEEHVLYLEDTLRQASTAQPGSLVQERLGDEIESYLGTLATDELEQTLALYQERNNVTLGKAAEGIFSFSQGVAIEAVIENEPHLVTVSRIIEAGKSEVPLIAIYGELKDLSFEQKREVFRLFERETGRNLLAELSLHGIEGQVLSGEFLREFVLGTSPENVQRELFTRLADYAQSLGAERGMLLAQKGLPDEYDVLELWPRDKQADGVRLVEVTERIEALEELARIHLGDTAGAQIITLSVRESEQAARFEAASEYVWRFGNQVRSSQGLHGNQEASKVVQDAFATYLSAQDAHLNLTQKEQTALQEHFQHSYDLLDRKIESAIGHAEDIARAGEGRGTEEGDLWRALTGHERSDIMRRLDRKQPELVSLRDAEEMRWIRKAFFDKQNEDLHGFLEYEFSGWGEGKEQALVLEYGQGRHSVAPQEMRSLSYDDIQEGLSARALIDLSLDNSPETTFALSLQETLTQPDPIFALQELVETSDPTVRERGVARFEELHGKSYLDILQERFGADGLRIIEEQNPYTGKMPTCGDTAELAASILGTGGLSAENTAIYIQRRMLESATLRGQAQALGTTEANEQIDLLDSQVEALRERYGSFLTQVPELDGLYEKTAERTYQSLVFQKLQEYDLQLAVYENLNSTQSSKKGDDKVKARARREQANDYCTFLAERAQYAQTQLEALKSISQGDEQVLHALRTR
ncbi:MAG: nitrogen fixation protein NifQ, partial [Bdellovibrionales bacterium]|nr:nitrogen fixation protein NifQ [Bdellovibrionales bacterium]